jgi:dTDP-4-dehydrorhamnose reductase
LKILLAGAGGQLGRCLPAACPRHEIIPLARTQLDITNADMVAAAIAAHRPALLINAAAFNDVDGAESRGAEAYAINAQGPGILAAAAAACGIPLLHVSTDYVFDGALQRPYHEYDRTNPLSAYGASKLAGETAVRAANPRHYIVRTAWLFWEEGKNFLLSMYHLAARPQLKVVSDQASSPTYVPHLARAIGQLIETEAYGTYHCAGKGGASRWGLVTELFQRMRVATPIIPVSHEEFPAAARRPASSVLTTIQQPCLELPPWQAGVDEFSYHLKRLNFER